jgi:hypothetical protein
MENVKRFIFVVALFSISMVVIHTSRAPQVVSMDIRTACLPAEIANKLNSDAALKWNAQIAYDTTEHDGKAPESYRCYIKFPNTDAVCTPRTVANRKDLQTCPSFPSLVGKSRTCYFLNKEHHPFAKRLGQREPRMSMKDLNGIAVHTIEDAKKVLLKKEK